MIISRVVKTWRATLYRFVGRSDSRDIELSEIILLYYSVYIWEIILAKERTTRRVIVRGYFPEMSARCRRKKAEANSRKVAHRRPEGPRRRTQRGWAEEQVRLIVSAM